MWFQNKTLKLLNFSIVPGHLPKNQVYRQEIKGMEVYSWHILKCSSSVSFFCCYFNFGHLCSPWRPHDSLRAVDLNPSSVDPFLMCSSACSSCHCGNKMCINHDFQARKFHICFDNLQWILYQKQFLVRILWTSPCKVESLGTFWCESLPSLYGVALHYWPRLLSNKWPIL